MTQHFASKQLSSLIKLISLGFSSLGTRCIGFSLLSLLIVAAAPASAEISLQRPDTNSSFSSFTSQTEPEFLPVHEAFKTILSIEGSNIIAQWQIADGYYMYRERFKFRVTNEENAILGTPQFDHEGKVKHDAAFGDVEVYTHQVAISIPFENKVAGQFEVVATFQGCA
ncbi:MAG: protein-disulfide reductase DsbD N-terminal domain-containing protein, partial [Pseudomonadales bacterium]|nr:protein-disulfide reductase DsbD N-terminal domain-containing protein [Pseudomonadales bacterium]